ncbi:hypothetical protein J5N97_024393 [Dioscorea zingiberensis]|uniref:HD domain-containing protein n=1 Tax=Dioscorea zingiberensis TaxID=325984 RepID=A0A9D5C6M7_9LILI|nr:hypothetical protein J5N97_024393 [Dioscorea zingiberensis]
MSGRGGATSQNQGSFLVREPSKSSPSVTNSQGHKRVFMAKPASLSQSLSRRRSPPLHLQILHQDVVVLLLTVVVVSSGVPPSSGVDFLSLCYRLKTTKRAGWIRRGVHRPESVADHMYRMGLMALIPPGIPGINRDR